MSDQAPGSFGDFDLDELDRLNERLEDPEPEPKPKPKRTKPTTKGKGTGTRKAPLQKRLATMIELVGTVVSGWDAYDGSVITDNAVALAEQLEALAKENPRVKRFLEGTLETSAWAGVLGVFGTNIMVPIAVHHSMLPEPINGNLATVFDIPVRPRKPKPNADTGEQLRVVD